MRFSWLSIDRDQGFSLIAAIMLVAVLALSAAVFSRAARTNAQITANTALAAEAEALADAGITLAVLDLDAVNRDRTRKRLLKTDGSLWKCSAGEAGSIAIRVQDESGKVDLNAANERLLAALFVSLGTPPDEAAKKAAAIVDWRDKDDKPLTRGAERDDYIAAGLGRGPKNGPFSSVDEIEQVLGFDSAASQRLRPYLSVHSGQAGIAPRVAAPGLARKLAEAARDQSSGFAGSDLSALGGDATLPAEFIAQPANRAFKVQSIASVPGGGRFLRETIVVFEADRRGTHILKDWRRGDSLDVFGVEASQPALTGAAASALPPC